MALNHFRLKLIFEVVQRVPDEQFNMENWSCGTIGCAMGHASRDPACQKAGLSVNHNGHPTYNGLKDWDATAAFIGVKLMNPVVDYLFSPENYKRFNPGKNQRLEFLKRTRKVMDGSYVPPAPQPKKKELKLKPVKTQEQVQSSANKIAEAITEVPAGEAIPVYHLKPQGEEKVSKKPTTKVEVIDIARKLVMEHLGVEESKITDTASFIDDLGADSLDTVELTMAFEEEFGIEISDEEAEKILTFGSAVDTTCQKLNITA